jgi:hypothetical protein
MTDTNGRFPPSVTACRIYERTSAKGNRYFSGRWGGTRVTLLPTREIDDAGNAIWEMRLAQAPPSQATTPPTPAPATDPKRGYQAPLPRPESQVPQREIAAAKLADEIPF